MDSVSDYIGGKWRRSSTRGLRTWFLCSSAWTLAPLYWRTCLSNIHLKLSSGQTLSMAFLQSVDTPQVTERALDVVECIKCFIDSMDAECCNRRCMVVGFGGHLEADAARVVEVEARRENGIAPQHVCRHH